MWQNYSLIFKFHILQQDIIPYWDLANRLAQFCLESSVLFLWAEGMHIWVVIFYFSS